MPNMNVVLGITIIFRHSRASGCLDFLWPLAHQRCCVEKWFCVGCAYFAAQYCTLHDDYGIFVKYCDRYITAFELENEEGGYF